MPFRGGGVHPIEFGVRRDVIIPKKVALLLQVPKSVAELLQGVESLIKVYKYQ